MQRLRVFDSPRLATILENSLVPPAHPQQVYMILIAEQTTNSPKSDCQHHGRQNGQANSSLYCFLVLCPFKDKCFSTVMEKSFHLEMQCIVSLLYLRQGGQKHNYT